MAAVTSKGQGQSKLDIGLNLKHSKQNKELLGYVKRGDYGGWMFSSAAQKIIMEYTRKFPRLFDTLGVIETQFDQIYETDLLTRDVEFPRLFDTLGVIETQFDQIYETDLLTRDVDETMLQEVQEWIKSLPISKQEPMPCGSDVLDDQLLVEIEDAIQKTKKTPGTKAVKVRVRPYLLFRPSDYLGNILPDSNAEFQLFDRVINVKLNSAVPFGLRGTIVGFHEGEDDEEMVEVMFDESFIGNQPIR
ncbi:5'-3' exoribonuclease 1 [Exaiptasia diaphana]|nr:5'-3' exoribonuclease 1 [Exaiptasia diaphana]